MIEHENGAKRSEVRPLYNLIPREPLEAAAHRFHKGLKYGRDNWKKGGPEFFLDAENHVVHHLFAFLNRDESEESNFENLAAATWGTMVLCWWWMTGKQEWEKNEAAKLRTAETVPTDRVRVSTAPKVQGRKRASRKV